MADLSRSGKKYALVVAFFFLLCALTLAAVSMFYVGWIKYTVTPPASPSQDFRDGQTTRYIYNSRHRGLFYYTVDDVESSLVKDNNGNRYFAVMYNYNATSGVPQTIGFWSITALMKASVGLHIGYLVTLGLALFLIMFTSCFGRAFIKLSLPTIIIGLIAGGVGLGLFHMYTSMEKTSNIASLPDIQYHWSEELKVATVENLYLSYGIHIGSFGASILALLLIILIVSSGNDNDKQHGDEGAPSDKVNIYTRDNLAYDDAMADRPARAELFTGFDRLSEKRMVTDNGERRMRANYPTQPEYNGHGNGQGHGHGHHHHHHHHHLSDRGDDRLERLSTPVRQHYHADPNNFPIRY